MVNITALPQFTRERIDEAEKQAVLSTVDQQTGIIEEPTEPLKTLASMNRRPGQPGAFFGQNATLESGERAIIKVGDRLIWMEKDEVT
jgi:uncharacterized protein YcbX